MTTPLEAQGGMDGQDVVDDESSKDMMEHDPNIVNPINQEGYGKNVPTSVGDSAGKHFLALCINWYSNIDELHEKAGIFCYHFSSNI